MGVLAMRALAELISGHALRPRRTILDVELVVRQSCGMHQRA